MRTQNLIFGCGVVGVFLYACSTDSLVGGECRSGYSQRDGVCAIVAASNIDHGSSGDVVPVTIPTTSPTSSLPDADSGAPDAGEDASTPPVVVFPPPGEPPLVCTAPLVACHGDCIEVDDDPLNCGACGRVCASNICSSGTCQGATPGDIVVIGHDMSQARAGTVQAKVLGNAVGIPSTDPIRVLSYPGGESAVVVALTHAVAAAGIGNRTIIFTTATDAALDDTSLYASYDVVLFQGAGATPFAMGQRWANPLSVFTKAGGVFVAIDRGDTDVPALVRGAGLLTLGGHSALPTATKFAVTSASDVVGYKLLSPYAAVGTSDAFTGVEAQSSDVSWVVRTADVAARPVVIHKIAR